MKKVLITGFEPFGGEKVNPALEAVKMLPDTIGGAKVVKLEVPTVFKKSIKRLDECIEKEKPDITICVGQAGGRFDITVERVAINVDDARIPDNENNSPADEKIFEDGENAYFASLPIKTIVKNITDAGIPASISDSAGTFVCNHLMYGLLYLIDKKYNNMAGGFIHVPFIPQQASGRKNTPSMNVSDIVKALTIAVETAVQA